MRKQLHINNFSKSNEIKMGPNNFHKNQIDNPTY